MAAISSATSRSGSASAGRAARGSLPLSAALDVLLVKAVEEADADGSVIGPAERSRAAVEARAASGASEILARRARALLPVVTERWPALGRIPRNASVPGWLVGLVAGAAAAAGLGSNALGPAALINILAVPVLSLLGWNAAVYAALALRGALARASAIRSPGLAAAIARAARWTTKRALRGEVPGHGAPPFGRAVVESYLDGWQRVALPALVARARALLHLGAAAMAAGLALGMYVRGIVFEYRATWESTFLGPAEVRAFLALVLGPAAAVLGREVPSAEMLAQIRAPASGEAALWVHLYAVSLGLWIVAPRLVLALLAAGRGRRLAASVAPDLDTPYFRRLVAEHRGEAALVDVLPYSRALSAAAVDRLRRTLEAAEGTPVEIRVGPAIAYGGDPAAAMEALDASQTGDRAERWVVVAASLAQPPEPEVHGEALRELAERARASGRRLLVVVDGADYARRLGGGPVAARRLAERRAGWDRVAASAGLTPLHWDLGEPIPAVAARPA